MAKRDIDAGFLAPGGDSEAVWHLKEAVAAGKPWYIALLEAVGLWSCSEENRNGHGYRYLIDGEAFDWLLLAERLCEEIADAVPRQELTDLLFFGRLPDEVSDELFRELIGSAKYHAYLNYFYGVTVEKFVVLAVEDEIRKERIGLVFSARDMGVEDGYERVYGASQDTLLLGFREEKGYPCSGSIAPDELQEFTYWLFKYRLANCDRERVASDTKKGLEYLKRLGQSKRLRIPSGSVMGIVEQACRLREASPGEGCHPEGSSL